MMVRPEIGGKIWTAIEKSTGEHFMYYNHVLTQLVTFRA